MRGVQALPRQLPVGRPRVNDYIEAKYRPNHDPWLPSSIDRVAEALGVERRDICCICLRPIKTQIMKGSGVCSELCRKDRDNDHEPFIPVNLKIHEGEDK